MFRKKNAPKISIDRIQSVLKAGAGPVKRPRAEREGTWADCELHWYGAGGVNGVLMDVSDTGARVRFVHRGALPGRVRLTCARLKLNRTAEVVRRDGTDVGLKFVDDDETF